ncbi:LysR family transcriptional regulator [Streptomyces sp. WAC05374]|uniref:LysR family transcriptional regulator n=1 Tax=Streptomyces sp. WAC05374 TaxID=2487420 RepID=UPI001055ED56|nr:LysR family transcriptional regulator [Streptomyces sp. WAC05374]TDF48294.1 LysR family transcriptional regulator [Streptomyces sp. WAC05374]TDF49253.1 LysR family transcriptional regulator [Streptomyces sp. WAC05374]
MELRQLECFVAVAEELGFVRAAERLHAVPASVSRRIARLEAELGLRLFDRSATHGVRLTAAGERLLPEARAALAAAARVRDTAAGITAGTEGLVRLGTSRAFADRVYRALDVLAARRPGLRVRLERAPQEARLAAVRSGTFDAALVRTVRRADGVALHPLWDEPLIVALPASHALALDLADGEAPGLDRLARLPLRLVPRAVNPDLHDLVTAALPGWTPGPPFTTLLDTLAELAAHPEPSWTLFHPVGPLPPTPRIAFRTLPGLTAPVSLALPADRPPAPPLQALLEALTAMAPAGHPAAVTAMAPAGRPAAVAPLSAVRPPVGTPGPHTAAGAGRRATSAGRPAEVAGPCPAGAAAPAPG